jgi:hypothetical protein
LGKRNLREKWQNWLEKELSDIYIEILGDYKLEQTIGFVPSYVYKVIHQLWRLTLAIKMISEELMFSGRTKNLFFKKLRFKISPPSFHY